MAVVTMRQLLESGVHFIFTERNGIYIVDLQQSLTYIDRAYEFVSETVAHGGSVLFVGTKKQAQEPVAEQAARVGMPYVNQRWLGGMLTNFTTVHKRLQRLKELEQIDFDDVAASGLTKKELLVLRREKDKLARTLGGIRDMAKVPSAVWIVDPDQVDYPIPGNDDAIRAVQLLTRVVADAVADGLLKRHSGASAAAEGETAAEAEPLAEWERELLAGAEADAAAETAQSAEPEAEPVVEPAAEPVVESVVEPVADEVAEAIADETDGTER